jgi:monofunctional biosynthetic peptidoglycan transglycosylase
MPRQRSHRRRRWIRWAIGLILLGVAIAHGTILIQVVRLRKANPEMTALMKERAQEARARGAIPRRVQIWVPYGRISPHLVRAVLAGEDPRFFIHHGFDWVQIREALKKNIEEGEIVRGASTITQQLAKNLFLSTARHPIRKLHEAVITVELELILGKRRILELYLNVIEWGDGIYGAEAAAQHYFGCSAAHLSPEQAAFLAAIIPNPRQTYNPTIHPQRVERRRRIIRRRMPQVFIPARFLPAASPRPFSSFHPGVVQLTGHSSGVTLGAGMPACGKLLGSSGLRGRSRWATPGAGSLASGFPPGPRPEDAAICVSPTS